MATRLIASGIENRFASVDAMFVSMERVMEPRATVRSEESQLERIRQAMDTQASRRQEATHQRLTEAHQYIFRVFEEAQKFLQRSTGITLATVRHGFSSVRDTKRTLSWIRPGSEDTVLLVTFDVREAGDEIVIHLSGDPVHRMSIASPGYDGRFDETIRGKLITRLDEAVTNQELSG